MQQDRFYIEAAIKEAEKAFNDDTYPIGAVIVDPTGEIIGRGRNQVYSKGDFIAHAELEAIRAARGTLMREQNYEKCTLYTTYEPCFMCCGAIFHARIARVVWLNEDEKFGALLPLHDDVTFQDRDKDFYDYCSKYFSRFNACKYKKLRIDRLEDEGLQVNMQALMLKWNQKKEQRLDLWKGGDI